MELRELLLALEARLESLENSGIQWLNVSSDPLARELIYKFRSQALAQPVTQPAAQQPVQPASPQAHPPAHPQQPPQPKPHPAPPATAPAASAQVASAQVASAQVASAQVASAQKPAPPETAPAQAASPAPFQPPPMEQISTLESLQVQYRACPRCALARTRNRLVFGVGHEAARLLFIGEGPGADEDSQGLPFVGRAGRLLTGFISALGLTRDDVYITNVVKCRPPENRNPEPDETASCMPILKKQIELINPRIIVTLGNVPLRALQPDAPGITKARGIPLQLDGRTILPTYHPSYLLRNPAGIPDCWRDFRKALEMAYGS